MREIINGIYVTRAGWAALSACCSCFLTFETGSKSRPIPALTGLRLPDDGAECGCRTDPPEGDAGDLDDR
jgi:hypothetical protein